LRFFWRQEETQSPGKKDYLEKKGRAGAALVRKNIAKKFAGVKHIRPRGKHGAKASGKRGGEQQTGRQKKQKRSSGEKLGLKTNTVHQERIETFQLWDAARGGFEGKKRKIIVKETPAPRWNT